MPHFETPPMPLQMLFKLLMVLAGFSVAITSVFTAVFIALRMWFD